MKRRSVLRPFAVSGLVVSFCCLQGVRGQTAGQQAAAQNPPSVTVVGLGTHVVKTQDDAANAMASTVRENSERAARLPAMVASGAATQAGAPTASSGLTINAIFDSSITGDPNSAAIQSAINTAISNIQSQFTDPITVTIYFENNGSVSLGQSTWYYATSSYLTFINALRADSSTSDDSTAIAQLPSASINPVNGGSNIAGKLANFRAVGISVNSSSCGANPSYICDGWIDVNMSITSPGVAGSSNTYSLQAVVEHEIDEVLGLGSALGTGLPYPTPEDLFRYNAAGNRTYSTTDSRAGGVNAYFSLDRFTDLAEFDNQNDGGDFGDWQSNPLRSGVAPKVQDAFATPGGTAPALSVELQALDVIGYNRSSGTPAPTITVQPSNQTIGFNTTATLNVTATGSPTTYQWYAGSSGVTTNPVGTNSSSYTTPALTNNTKYWVRVSNAGGSVNSSTAQVTVTFTDSTLTVDTTPLKAVHVSELRTRVNALRARYNLTAVSFTDPTITVDTTTIKAVHITELRSALDAVYSTAGQSHAAYTDPSLGVGTTVKAAHITELRAYMQQIE